MKTDKAAVWYAANSLMDALHRRPGALQELSDENEGQDNAVRSYVLPAAEAFERWACRNVDFGELVDIWGYKLEDEFGSSWMAIEDVGVPNDHVMLAVALNMRLPVKAKVALRHERRMVRMLTEDGISVSGGIIRKPTGFNTTLHTIDIIAGWELEHNHTFTFRTDDPRHVKRLTFP